MSTPLTQFNPELLVLVFAVSLVGMLLYLLLRLVEVRAPLLVVFSGLPSAFFLVNACFKLDSWGSFDRSTRDWGWTAFFIVWILACITLGARFHRPIRTSYGSLSDALLMTGVIASGIWFVSFAGSEVTHVLPHTTYAAGIYLEIPSLYLAMFFCAAAPVATAFLLEMLHKSQYRPGVDRHLYQEEKLQ